MSNAPRNCLLVVTVTAVVCCVLYLLLFKRWEGNTPHHRHHRRNQRNRCLPDEPEGDRYGGDLYDVPRVPPRGGDTYFYPPEMFEEGATVPEAAVSPLPREAAAAGSSPMSVVAPDAAPRLTLQEVVDFSDVIVTADQRAEVQTVADNSKQIQSVNERFDAAKRKVADNRLRPGMHSTKERRRIVDNLLRRPHCSRRVRSWRTENSDTLRGDVVPKRTSAWGMLRAGRSNPDIDLHPGSMGILSGLGGRWLSEEIVADNDISDPL